MKFWGRLTTALAAIATLLVICALAMPTVVGYGADSLFWDVWGRVYTGDNIQTTVTVKYVEAPSAEANEDSMFGDSGEVIRVVDASGLEVYEVYSADAGLADYAAAFSEGTGLISMQGSEGSARVLSASSEDGALCIWKTTLNSALHPMLPADGMEIYFAARTWEDQIVDVNVTVWIRAQAEGDPVVQVQVATEGRSQNGPHARNSVSADWGNQIMVTAAE